MPSFHKKEIINIGGFRFEAHYERAHKYKGSLQVISQVGPEARMLDVGSGERRLNLPNFFNVDASKNKFIDIVVDAHHLPFRNNIFDLIICEHLLEHVKKPWIVIEEIYRITAFGGSVYIEVPFMTPYHGRPHHYFNMTKDGVEQLCEKFQKVRSGVQSYNMPSHTLAMIFSRYLRCLLKPIDKKTEVVELYDTGVNIKGNSSMSAVLLGTYRAFERILSVLNRFIGVKKAEEIAVAVFFLGNK